jgi:hypothetical protein
MGRVLATIGGLAIVLGLAAAAGGSPTITCPAQGCALSFNGSSQYVTFGAAPGLNAATFTVETWFNRSGAGVGTSTGTNGLVSAIPLVSKGRAEQETPANLNMNYFLGIDDSSGTLVADFEDNTNGGNHPISGVTAVTSNVWHHAAATYDGSTWRLYLDGRLDAKSVVGAFSPESTSIQHAGLASALNSTGVAAGFFQGMLDEPRIWNLARSGAQIRGSKNQQLTSGTGLVGRWSMNEGTGTTIADSAAPAQNGTLTNGPPFVAGYTFPGDTTAPAAPTGLVATPGDSSVSLSWTASVATDVAGYNVYRSTTTPVNTATATLLNGTDLVQGTTFTDTTAVNGTKYYYVVVTVDTANNVSGKSNEVNATPVAGAPALILVGAGDIADCGRTQDTATAALIGAQPATANVFTIGDNVYPNGTAAEFTNCYDTTWGPYKARTRPSVGNHDYGNGTNPGAPNYFAYFGANAGDPALGYYSYNIGTAPNLWHIVVLNAECDPNGGYWLPGGCAAGSTQETWLKNDLRNSPTNNIIGMWHRPRFSSSASYSYMQPLWQDLYDCGAEVSLAGHEHDYERFAPMNATGGADPLGVRAITVGTGGAALGGFGTILPNSEVRGTSTSYGVIKFTLHASSYDWQFIPIAGETFTDSGTQAVHTRTCGGTTSVLLRSFTATRRNQSVVLRWRTGSEPGLLGFNLYRARRGGLTPLNRAPVRAVGTTRGHAYTLRTELPRGVTAARYRLQAVRLDGRRAWLATASAR